VRSFRDKNKPPTPQIFVVRSLLENNNNNDINNDVSYESPAPYTLSSDLKFICTRTDNDNDNNNIF